MSLFHVDLLPAREGDCLWIEYGDLACPCRILVDGGRQIAYRALKQRFAALPAEQRRFELLILTHVDADHVEGLLKLIRDPELPVIFKDVWFNGYRHLQRRSDLEAFGAKQGDIFIRGVLAKGWNWNAAFDGMSVVIPEDGKLPTKLLAQGMKLTVLSPTWDKLEKMEPVWRRELKKAGLLKPAEVPDTDTPDLEAFGALTVEDVETAAASAFEPDDSVANGTSICILAEFDGRGVVLTGDAHAAVVGASLAKLRRPDGPLKIDAFKLSHHGSRGTHSVSLLTEMHSKRFLISTDGSRHKHPHVEALARTVKHAGGGAEFIFNYRSVQAVSWDIKSLQSYYGYKTTFPSLNENGTIRVTL